MIARLNTRPEPRILDRPVTSQIFIINGVITGSNTEFKQHRLLCPYIRLVYRNKVIKAGINKWSYHGCSGARYSEIINWHNSGWHWNYYSQEFWVLTQLLNLGHHYRLEQQVLAPAWSNVWAYTKSISWSNSNISPDQWLINLAAQEFLALIQHDLQSDSPHRSCRFKLLFGAQLLTNPTYRTMRALNQY